MPAGKASLALSYRATVSVDHGSPVPAYLQLAEIIRGRIAAGEWSRGPLPSSRAFQETYGVGEYVVTRAIRLLEDEGLVFTVPRRGVYVRQPGGS
jgi:DNA-binding GntR family transcriptional regulator